MTTNKQYIGPDDSEYYETFTVDQLRALASSTNPAHIVYGLMAAAELLKRGI